ncbi:hypothetical protein GF412_02920 [Candidatus Micrarchaeota archaeon]|nr:hypothetical protein [Candidatus Micrarchaeota archaeon]MBD3417905.1 hypothetical protein [Candidatus Micrarchaeota archaeon]
MSKKGTANGKRSLVDQIGLKGDGRSPEARQEALRRAVEQGRRSFLGLPPLDEPAKPKISRSRQDAADKPSIHSPTEPSTLGPEKDITNADIDSMFDSFEEGHPPVENAGSDPFEGLSADSINPPPPASPEEEGQRDGGETSSSDSISMAVINAVETAASSPPAAPGGNQGDAEQEITDPSQLKSETPTLPPPPLATGDPESLEREEDGRRTAVLPGSPPESGLIVEPEEVAPRGEPTGRTASRLSELSTMEHAAEIPLENTRLREKSYVPLYVDNAKSKLPERFHPYFDKAMELIEKNIRGYEPDIEKLIVERRWKIEREQKLLGSIAAASDEIQKVFEKMHKDEAVRRVQIRHEDGTMTPSDAIKNWAFTILSSRSPKDETQVMADSNVELNVFDAYAKAVTFLLLSQHRPRTFIYALGHPEISKPYGQLGGMEGLGVLAGLDLPDPKGANNIPNPMIGFAFRHAQECHSSTLIGWIQDVVVKWPKAHVVGRFAYFVQQEIRDFQEAVKEAGFSAERFFHVLTSEHNSPEALRSDPALKSIFESACTGSGKVVYAHPDDIFDALESIVGYMNMLKYSPSPNLKGDFMEHFLGTYPLTSNGGTFWKVFNMCLFTDKKDMEGHPDLVNAFRNDPDRDIQIHIEDAIHQLQPRKTLIEAVSGPRDDDSIRFDLDDDF